MKSILLLFALVLFKGSSTKEIPWKSQNQLSWKDFKGRPSRTSSYYAMTYSGIAYGYSQTTENGKVKLEFTINSSFNPKKSWVKRDKKTPALLKHEHIHFDITELYTRRLRTACNSFEFTDKYKKEVDSIFKHYNNKMWEVQAKYDEETNHSINEAEQNKWNDFVKQELEKTLK